jgi:opacity protein-like surface antigen
MRRLLTLALVLISTSVLAQEERGPYIGLGLGQLDYEDTFLNRLDYDDTMTSTSIRGGFRFNETLAFEGVYGNPSSFNVHKSGLIPTFLAENGTYVGGEFDARLSGDLDYMEVRVLAHAGHVLFGLGYYTLDVTGNIVGTTQLALNEPPQPAGASFSSSLSDSDHGYSILIGAQWDFSERWGIRAEYEYFDVSSPADVLILGVGVQYKF